MKTPRWLERSKLSKRRRSGTPTLSTEGGLPSNLSRRSNLSLKHWEPSLLRQRLRDLRSITRMGLRRKTRMNSIGSRPSKTETPASSSTTASSQCSSITFSRPNPSSSPEVTISESAFSSTQLHLLTATTAEEVLNQAKCVAIVHLTGNAPELFDKYENQTNLAIDDIPTRLNCIIKLVIHNLHLFLSIYLSFC